MLCFRHLARPAMGVKLSLMHQLFLAVAVPCFTYATDIWFTPVCRHPDDAQVTGSVGIARRLTSVQRIATLAITGAICSTASDFMEAHVNLALIELLLHKACHKVALRFASLPETHLLHKPVKLSMRRYVNQHRSPLHNLMHTCEVEPGKYKVIKMVDCPPNRGMGFCTRMADTREESKAQDAADQAKIKVYSD